MELLNGANELPDELPDSLHIIKETPQVRGLLTFIRNRESQRFAFTVMRKLFQGRNNLLLGTFNSHSY